MVNCFPNMHKSLGSKPSTARSKLMTVQNVKICSLGNSKLTEHPMSVSALTVLDPQPRLSVMSGLPVLPHSEKKK